jgi:hypothetical protein
MDPVITEQIGREHPLARYLDDFLADLANAGASRRARRRQASAISSREASRGTPSSW